MDALLHFKQFRSLFFILALGAVQLLPADANAQCSSPTLKFHSPVLLSGDDKQVGAVYLFQEVIPGVDAQIMIADIVGGATLYNIDDSTGIGYYDAFQPYVGAAPFTVSYIDWKITFKVGGTNDDTTLACVAVTGVDVDGDGGHLQEFIEAATPGSIAVDPVTILNVSFDGVRSKAVSTIFNIPLIDSSHHEAMFQMNFVNINTLDYRNGAISLWGHEQIRQTCIYFKPFFDETTFVVLACKLLDFSARQSGVNTRINWTACNETNLKNYVIQKSVDGKTWKDIQVVSRAASSGTNKYVYTDTEKNTGKVFYRLKQLSTTGRTDLSKAVMVANEAAQATITHTTMVTGNLSMQIVGTRNEEYIATYYTSNGTKVGQDKINIFPGINIHTKTFSAQFTPGVYFLVITDHDGQQVHTSRLIKS